MYSSKNEDEQNNLFPIFLKLEKLETLIVGGGNVGLEKLTALLNNSPDAGITLIGKDIHPNIKILANTTPNLILKERAFAPNDLQNKDIAIIATNDPHENKKIHQLTKKNKILVNVADTPALCDFYLGSIVRKGNLKIAISTNGKSPTLAKRLRETFTAVFPDEINDVLQNLREIRDELKGNFDYKVKKLNEITNVMTNKTPENTIKK